MDTLVAEGLRISLTSYLLIFGVLAVFYALIKLLWKMPPPREGS
ncbi:MAG: hypothetical protein ABFC79_03735 [Candidatus Cryosericum sp.]|jgi:hypothetical protein|nr:hypothetical protein [Candidatus Cryosericum sp.]HPS69289.1 hypothetical protein [Candidatus Cryosericum sp.]